MKKIILSTISVLLSLCLSFGQTNVTSLRFINGNVTSAGTTNGTIYFDLGTNKFTFRQGGAWHNLVFLTDVQTLTNKTLTSPQLTGALLETTSTADHVWTATNSFGAGSWKSINPISDLNSLIKNNVDITKMARFDASGITTGTTRTYNLPNSNGTIALSSTTLSGYGITDAWSLATGGTFSGTNNILMGGFNLNLLNGNVLSGPTGSTITSNTRLDVRGITGGTIQRWADNNNTLVMDISNEGSLVVRGIGFFGYNYNLSRGIQIGIPSDQQQSIYSVFPSVMSSLLSPSLTVLAIGGKHNGSYFTTPQKADIMIGVRPGTAADIGASEGSVVINPGLSDGAVAGNKGYTFHLNSVLSVTQPNYTSQYSLVQPALKVIGGVHTSSAMIASTEYSDVNIDLSGSVTFQTGNISTLRSVKILPRTYDFVTASTISDAATFEVVGAPIAGPNATMTRRWAARILGNTAIGGSMIIGQPLGTTVPSAPLEVWNTSSGSEVSQLILRNNANIAGTGLAIDFVPELSNNALARISVVRQSFSTGGTSLNFQTWDGASLISRVYVKEDGNVGIGTTSPQSSSILDLTSTNKALLLTRVTNIASVTTPTNGMVTYDASTNLFNFYQASSWITFGDLTHIVGKSATPSIIAGPGAGTGGPVSITGTDLGGIINITTGTAPAGSNAIIATIIFAAAYTVAPKIIIYPANRAARDLAIGAWPIVPANGNTNGTTPTTFVLESGTTALGASTPYQWGYHILQ